MPLCVWPVFTFTVNGDLAAAYIDGEAAFLQCQAARNVLDACIQSYKE